MPGRKKLPTKLKELKGTARAHRENPNEPEPEVCVPDPPGHLSSVARAEWDRITRELVNIGIISLLDRATLAMICQTWGRILELEIEIREKGIVSPEMKALDREYEKFRKLAPEFGLTPASRSKVHAMIPKKDKSDEWDDFEPLKVVK